MGKGIVKLGEGQWAVKDGNLLAAKETNGRFKNAEFTVARGTRATYVGRDGLIKESNLQDVNLVTNGTFDTDSDWIKGGGATISGGQGNIVGDGSSFTFLQQSDVFTIGNTYKITVDVTINSGLGLKFQDGSTNENFGFATTSGSYTFYGVANNEDFVIGRRTGGTAFDSSIDNISVQEVKTDTPRIDFTDNTDGHLLLEPQSTNLVTYSEDFSEWTLLGNTNINSTNITSPSGENNATNITGLNGSGSNDLRKQLTYNSANKSLTFSVYLKGSGTLRVQMSNGVDQAFQNVITLTNQWQRYSVSGTFNSTSVSIFYLVIDDYSGLTATSYDVWGAQFEELSYPTSYIPTNSGQVTRDGELVSRESIDEIDIPQKEGTIYLELEGYEKNTEIFNFDRSTSNSIHVGTDSNGVLKVWGYYEPSGTQTSTSAMLNNNTRKVAIAFKNGSFIVYADGEEELNTSTFVWTPTDSIDRLYFNRGGYIASQGLSKVKALRIYKEAFNTTQLDELTS